MKEEDLGNPKDIEEKLKISNIMEKNRKKKFCCK
jgi:hypothetical protein